MEQSSRRLVLASLQHERKYTLILFPVKMMVFVKTGHMVISCLEVGVRKPELKNIYQADHQYGGSDLINKMDLEISPKVR